MDLSFWRPPCHPPARQGRCCGPRAQQKLAPTARAASGEVASCRGRFVVPNGPPKKCRSFGGWVGPIWRWASCRLSHESYSPQPSAAFAERAIHQWPATCGPQPGVPHTEGGPKVKGHALDRARRHVPPRNTGVQHPEWKPEIMWIQGPCARPCIRSCGLLSIAICWCSKICMIQVLSSD